MKDGLTRRIDRTPEGGGIEDFLARYEARIVALSGSVSGTAYVIDREVVTVGRGPGVDMAFPNPAMSRQHAVIEFSGSGFRIRDLGSTNGVEVNGRRVQVSDVGHGDRFEIGGQGFQLVIEEREEAPNTYDLSAEV